MMINCKAMVCEICFLFWIGHLIFWVGFGVWFELLVLFAFWFGFLSAWLVSVLDAGLNLRFFGLIWILDWILIGFSSGF